DVVEGVKRLYPEGFKPDERVAARIFLSVAFYSPGRLAKRLGVPWLVQVASILSRFPKFEDTWLGLSYAPHMPKHMVKETREVIAIARKFNEEVAKPLALKLDRLTHEDPDYLP